MNWRKMSPEERATRKVARRRLQTRLYYPRWLARVPYRKNMKQLRRLSFESLGDIWGAAPWDDRLRIMAPPREFKARIEEILDNDESRIGVAPCAPKPWLVNALRQEEVLTPTHEVGRYKPLVMIKPWFFDTEELAQWIIRFTDGRCERTWNVQGAATDCPYCGRFNPGKMTVHVEPGRDTIFRSWCCGKVHGSWAMLTRRFTYRDAATLMLCNAGGTGTIYNPKIEIPWAIERNAMVEHRISMGRTFYMAGVRRGKHAAAFGDWARYPGATVGDLPTMSPIKDRNCVRKEYLLRLYRTMRGEIARMDAYTLKFKPIFRHWFQRPQPIIETPWWAAWCPWDKMLVTRDRAMATTLERAELAKPHEQRTVVALLPPETELSKLPFEYIFIS